MRIAVCGANGFIGAALCQYLQMQGHEVWRGVRQPKLAGEFLCDFSQDWDSATWCASLVKIGAIDLLINAAGTRLNATKQQHFQVHCDGPMAMYRAAAQLSVRAYFQLSALGQESLSSFVASKHELDRQLQQLDLPGWIVRPSLVVAEAGTSSRLFRIAALLPRLMLPASSPCPVQPVALSDLLSLLQAYLDGLQSGKLRLSRQMIVLAGPEALSLAQMLQRYRARMGLPNAKCWYLPGFLWSVLATLSQFLPHSVLTPASWRLLCAGNVASAEDQQQLQRCLGRKARQFDHDLLGLPVQALRAIALLQLARVLCQLVLAWLWIWTAWVSFAVYPREQSYALLAATAIPSAWQALTLNLACGLDLSLGLACIFLPGRRLWLAQIALILTYSVVIAWALPEYYWHPFAPLIKNLSVLALLAFLLVSDWLTQPGKR